MNRRSFLKAFGLGAAALALAPRSVLAEGAAASALARRPRNILFILAT